MSATGARIAVVVSDPDVRWERMLVTLQTMGFRQGFVDGSNNQWSSSQQFSCVMCPLEERDLLHYHFWRNTGHGIRPVAFWVAIAPPTRWRLFACRRERSQQGASSLAYGDEPKVLYTALILQGLEP